MDCSTKSRIMITKDVKSMINMNLKKLRERKKYTQEEVAYRIGVSRQAVAKWENGKTVPDINNCLALAELYEVALDDLVKDSDEKKGMALHPRGKHLFGLVKVGERGQIVIPKKAREIFGICPGDSLLVVGDEAQGIALIEYDKFKHFIEAVLQAEEQTEE